MNRFLLSSTVLLASLALSQAASADELEASQPGGVSSSPARSRTSRESSAPDAVKEPRRGFEPWTVSVEAGLRVGILTDDGFDPYAERDFLAQGSFAGGLVLLDAGPLSIGVRGGWDIGAASATPRGTSTTLTVHRLSAGPEARYAFAPWFSAFTRVAAGAIHLRGTIEEPGFDRPMYARTWAFGLDASGGLAFRVGRFGRGEVAAAELWLTAEAGYGFAGETEMVFTPASSADEARRFGDTVLPPLRPAGAMNRFALGLTF